MGICDKTEKMELANKQQHHQFKDKMAQRIVDFGYVVRSWESHRSPAANVHQIRRRPWIGCFFFLFLESVVVRTDGKNSTATSFLFSPHESDVVVYSNQLDAYRVAQ